VARLEKNPLRILDSKDPRDRPAADSAPKMVLSGEAEDFFAKVREGLDAAGVAYEIAPHLVRGLDYYRHTAFEFVTDRLGAQGTVLGGGRYDGLIETLGGPHTPAVGWAAGIERLGMLIDVKPDFLISIIPDGEGTETTSREVAALLRSHGIGVFEAYRGNAKRRLEIASVRRHDGVLYVRTPSDPRGSLYFNQFSHSVSGPAPFRKIFDVLNHEFPGAVTGIFDR
jgi:histidyl-tRNA synthetase